MAMVEMVEKEQDDSLAELVVEVLEMCKLLRVPDAKRVSKTITLNNSSDSYRVQIEKESTSPERKVACLLSAAIDRAAEDSQEAESPEGLFDISKQLREEKEKIFQDATYRDRKYEEMSKPE